MRFLTVDDDGTPLFVNLDTIELLYQDDEHPESDYVVQFTSGKLKRVDALVGKAIRRAIESSVTGPRRKEAASRT
jgi:hypothetical protein